MNNTIEPGIFSLNYNKDFLMNFDHFMPKTQDHATHPLNGKMNFSATNLQRGTYRTFLKMETIVKGFAYAPQAVIPTQSAPSTQHIRQPTRT
ncbi:hypothetical protein HK28_00730 [Acetobacter sp. DsW_063]|nr:hypothetical protein HK28_00730 [Acetobacter sp. DsW_063]